MTYEADGRGDEHPTHLPPEEGIVPDHLLDVVVPLVGAVAPADGDALEHDEEDEAHS